MITGFEKIVEERILGAQRRGEFENLPGAGKPLVFEDWHMPEDLRLAYKILKNADCVPPEIELRKEILKTEELLVEIEDLSERYQTIKKLNFLIMKLNASRATSILFEIPQKYMDKLSDFVQENYNRKKGNTNEK
jgi:hypothetical protein